MTVKVVGLDLSLTSTGIAQIRYATDGSPLVQHTRVVSKPCGNDIAARSARLRTIAHQCFIAAAGADLVLVEGPAFSKTMGSMHDRSGLWWLTIARIEAATSADVVEVPPTSLKKYICGKGNAGKDEVLSETIRRFGGLTPTLATNDEADALVLAAMGWHHLTGEPLLALPAANYGGMKGLRWTA